MELIINLNLDANAILGVSLAAAKAADK